jgi:hypothetical protein
MKITVFLNGTWCSLVDRYQCFGPPLSRHSNLWPGCTILCCQDYVASDGRITEERWIWKYLEGSGRALIELQFRTFLAALKNTKTPEWPVSVRPGISLDVLRKITKTSEWLVSKLPGIGLDVLSKLTKTPEWSMFVRSGISLDVLSKVTKTPEWPVSKLPGIGLDVLRKIMQTRMASVCTACYKSGCTEENNENLRTTLCLNYLQLYWMHWRK